MPRIGGASVRAMCAQRDRLLVTSHRLPARPDRRCGRWSSWRSPSAGEPRPCSGPPRPQRTRPLRACLPPSVARRPTWPVPRGPAARSAPARIECYVPVAHTAKVERHPSSVDKRYLRATNAVAARGASVMKLRAAREPRWTPSGGATSSGAKGASSCDDQALISLGKSIVSRVAPDVNICLGK